MPDWGPAKIKINQTKVCKLMKHPVDMLLCRHTIDRNTNQKFCPSRHAASSKLAASAPAEASRCRLPRRSSSRRRASSPCRSRTRVASFLPGRASGTLFSAAIVKFTLLTRYFTISTLHGSLEPPIGQGLICSQETKCTAVFYDAYRF